MPLEIALRRYSMSLETETRPVRSVSQALKRLSRMASASSETLEGSSLSVLWKHETKKKKSGVTPEVVIRSLGRPKLILSNTRAGETEMADYAVNLKF